MLYDDYMWYHSPYRRRRPYNPWGHYNNYNYQQQLIDSNWSSVAQNIYNQGYMDGVNQSSVVNQFTTGKQK